MPKPRRIKHSKGRRPNQGKNFGNAIHALIRSVNGETHRSITHARVKKVAKRRGFNPKDLIKELNRRGFKVIVKR